MKGKYSSRSGKIENFCPIFLRNWTLLPLRTGNTAYNPHTPASSSTARYEHRPRQCLITCGGCDVSEANTEVSKGIGEKRLKINPKAVILRIDFIERPTGSA